MYEGRQNKRKTNNIETHKKYKKYKTVLKAKKINLKIKYKIELT